MLRKITPVGVALLLSLTCSQAQTPALTIVQAAPTSEPAPPAVTRVAPASSTESVFKLLEEMKAVNEVILSKQAATLGQLEEMEKAAEQIKIYSKRT